MASLSEELNKAAEGLSKFNRQIESLNRSSGNGLNGGTAFQAGIGAAFGGAVLNLASGAAGAIGSGLRPAANVFGSTGNASDAASVLESSVFESLSKSNLGGLAAGLTGNSRLITSKISAREEVGDALAPLARAGVPIGDDFLQGFIDQKVKQSEREFDFRQRVVAGTGVDAGEVADNASKRLADAIDRLIGVLDNIPGVKTGP